MQKINEFFKKNILTILIIFLLSQPFIDALTAVWMNNLNSNFTLGMIIRFGFLFFSLYYLLFVKKCNKKSLIYLGCVTLYGIIFLLSYLNTPLLFFELKGFLKIAYFLILAVFCYNIKDKLKEINSSYFGILFIIYLLLIIIPNVIGNFGSYDIAKIGEKGLFNSANEIGAIISFLFPLYLYQMTKSKKKLLYAGGLILYFVAIFIIGTKVPVVACSITILFYIVNYLAKIVEKKETKKILVTGLISVVAIIGCLLVVPKTPFYKNIKIHMNYFNINSFGEILTNYDNLNNIIFSERLTLIDDNVKIYQDANRGSKLIGLGKYEIKDEVVVERKTAEVDYVDIFTSYGMVGLFLFIALIVYLLTIFLVDYKKQGDKKSYIFVTYFLIFSIAMFSGHVFVAPSVSLLAALFLTNLDFE